MKKTENHNNRKASVSHILRWLTPGLGVKRWILLVLLGTTFIGLGLAILVLDVYRTAPDTWWLPLLSTASLRFLPRPVRVIVFSGIGFGILAGSIWALNRALLSPFIQPGTPLVDTLASFRRKDRGPRIVIIGGGTGLSTALRGLKSFTHNLTAVVTVADDGGSSGTLRDSVGILPPGDIRNCLAALSNDEALTTQLFQYRFADGKMAGLDGHSFGNLFLTALMGITGSFEEAIAESGRVLAVHGRVLPSTLQDVRLVADVRMPHDVNALRVEGESRIPKVSGEIRQVWLEPNNPPAFPKAIQAILAADMVVVGPGSLYTSILPNLLVPDVLAAFRASRALKIYVCNIATQPGETDGYTCGDHLQALENHLGSDLFDIILMNNREEESLPANLQWVTGEEGLSTEYPLHLEDVVDRDRPWLHDSNKLAKVLIALFQERTGPLSE